MSDRLESLYLTVTSGDGWLDDAIPLVVEPEGVRWLIARLQGEVFGDRMEAAAALLLSTEVGSLAMIESARSCGRSLLRLVFLNALCSLNARQLRRVGGSLAYTLEVTSASDDEDVRAVSEELRVRLSRVGYEPGCEQAVRR